MAAITAAMSRSAAGCSQARVERFIASSDSGAFSAISVR